MTTVTHTTTDGRSPAVNVPAVKLAYLVSRFPKLTETFVLYEVTTMERLGFAVDVYALQRQKTGVMHAEAERLMDTVHFARFLSLALLTANLRMLLRHPWRYLHTLFTLMRANWGSFRYFVGACVFYPKAVYFSHRMVQAGVNHLHAHFASHPAAMAYAIHRLSGIPYSFTAHGSDLHCDRHMLAEKVADATFTVTISDYNKQLICAEVPECNPQSIHVIHCGVDTEAFSVRQTPTSYEQDGGPFQILCTGTLHEVKGQRYLIDACWRLHQRDRQIECHFIGDGPDRSMLTQLVASYDADAPHDRSFRNCIHFHGQLRQAALRQRLQTADAAVTPSVPTSDGRREGIPVALMEAMATGVPTIASRLSGIPELIDDGLSGLLVAPGDVSGLAHAIERLMDDTTLRNQLGHAGRHQVEREFDLVGNANILASQIQATLEAPA
ncbi:MAG: colanic acid biosynthesis glycosyltransferase WcaL [Blastopirellula sp.]|nr:colanic acid biosynthesis glycosyltransferase WcaL [Blastopirellula sp.]